MTDSEAAEFAEKQRRLAELDAAIQRQRNRQLVEAATDYRRFIEYVMRDEQSNAPLILEAAQLSWIDHIQTCWERGLHAAIAAPFGLGKTTIVGIGLPLFALGIKPTLRIRSVTSDDTTSMQRVGLIRRYIESSNELHEVFPHLKPSTTQDWTKHELFIERATLAKDPSVQSCSILQGGMGGRVDLTIFDDINDPRNTLLYPKMRKQVFENFTRAYMNRLEMPWGRAVAILTRWHVQDLLGYILADEQMRSTWGVLIQRVSEDFSELECEYYYGQEDTPEYRTSAGDACLRLYNAGILTP